MKKRIWNILVTLFIIVLLSTVMFFSTNLALMRHDAVIDEPDQIQITRTDWFGHSTRYTANKIKNEEELIVDCRFRTNWVTRMINSEIYSVLKENDFTGKSVYINAGNNGQWEKLPGNLTSSEVEQLVSEAEKIVADTRKNLPRNNR